MCELCFCFDADYLTKPIVKGDILFEHLNTTRLKRRSAEIAPLIMRLASMITIGQLEKADTQAVLQTSFFSCYRERLGSLCAAVCDLCPGFKSELDYLQVALLDFGIFKNTRTDLSYSMMMGFTYLLLPLITSIKQIHFEHSGQGVVYVTKLTHLLDPLVLARPPPKTPVVVLRIKVPPADDGGYNGLYD